MDTPSAEEPESEPTLGPPHDVWATTLLTVALAVGLLFIGRGHVVGDWVSWAGLLTAAGETALHP